MDEFYVIFPWFPFGICVGYLHNNGGLNNKLNKQQYYEVQGFRNHLGCGLLRGFGDSDHRG